MSSRTSRAAGAPRAAWLCAALLIAVAPAPAAGWETVASRDGIVVERRAQEGSGLYEVRATTESALSPAAIFDTIWRQREHLRFVPHLKRLEILSEAGDERLTYEQVSIPLAQDRDYTVRLRRHVNAGAGRYEIVFNAAGDAGPPPDPNHVRVSTVRGRWLVEPGPGGQGARLRYEVFSDPGGSLPSWLVNRAQADSVPNLVRAMLDRTRDRGGRD